jgi:hypothetical protein
MIEGIKRASRIVDHFLFQTPAWYALMAAVVAGLIMILLAFASQIAIISLPDANGKSVGYVTALNWSFGFTLLAPFAIMFVVATAQSFELALRDMHTAGMFVTSSFSRASDEAIDSAVADFRSKVACVLLFWVAFGVIEGAVEWYVGSGDALVRGNPELAAKIDWSVAATFRPNLVSSPFDAFVGLLAFLYQGVFLGFFIGFLGVLCLAAIWIGRFASPRSGDNGIRLIVDTRSTDHRCGFEIFDSFFDNMLLFVGFAMPLLYLSQIQNNYLHDAKTKTLWEFLQNEFILGTTTDFSSKNNWQLTGEMASNLFEPTVLNFSDVSTMIGGLLLLAVVMLIIVIVLRQAAQDARRRTLGALADGHLGDGKLDPVARKRIEEMQMWPLAYLQLNGLVFLVATAILSIIFYKVGVVLAGAATAAVFIKAIAGLNKVGIQPAG